MQIRLVIGVRDARYLGNLSAYLEKNHMDKLEIVTFSSPELLKEYAKKSQTDVILVEEQFGIDSELLKDFGRAAYLCDGALAAEKNGIRTIAKYKKPDLIYKDILDLYAEGGSRHGFRMGGGGSGKICLVTGLSGGTGASTFAAALAKKYALQGKRVLYLNLEPAGMSTDFFEGSGTYHFEDVIFALKSQRADIRLKMESAARVDISGVNFFAPCSNPMYMLELNHEDYLKIMDTLSGETGYDHVIVDMNFKLTSEFMEILSRANQILLVQDGGETSNSKFLRAMEAVHIMEEQNHVNVTAGMKLLYNRFSSSKSSSEIPGLSIPVIGKLPPIKHARVHEIMDYMLTRQDIFEALGAGEEV